MVDFNILSIFSSNISNTVHRFPGVFCLLQEGFTEASQAVMKFCL